MYVYAFQTFAFKSTAAAVFVKLSRVVSHYFVSNRIPCARGKGLLPGTIRPSLNFWKSESQIIWILIESRHTNRRGVARFYPLASERAAEFNMRGFRPCNSSHPGRPIPVSELSMPTSRRIEWLPSFPGRGGLCIKHICCYFLAGLTGSQWTLADPIVAG